MRRRQYLLGIGIAIILLTVLAVGARPHSTTPAGSALVGPRAAETPSYPPIDAINSCGRLLVSRRQVASVLGFEPRPPAASNPSFLGCRYASHAGGLVVVGASSGFASPPRAGPIRPVQGIGEQALFTPRANRDFPWVSGPASAASMLQVRVGDLVLRFAGGRFDPATQTFRSYGLSALRRLATDALTTSRAWRCADQICT
jgi:hypothetical protein